MLVAAELTDVWCMVHESRTSIFLHSDREMFFGFVKSCTYVWFLLLLHLSSWSAASSSSSSFCVEQPMCSSYWNTEKAALQVTTQVCSVFSLSNFSQDQSTPHDDHQVVAWVCVFCGLSEKSWTQFCERSSSLHCTRIFAQNLNFLVFPHIHPESNIPLLSLCPLLFCSWLTLKYYILYW
jgi:hypothetical protein